MENELPQINQALCTQCGVCVEVCPAHVLGMTEEGPTFIRPEACLYCTDCEAICPVGAIRCEFVIMGP